MRYYVNFNYPSHLNPNTPRKVHCEFESLEGVEAFYGDNYVCCWNCCDGKLSHHTALCRMAEAVKGLGEG